MVVVKNGDFYPMKIESVKNIHQLNKKTSTWNPKQP